MRVYATFVIVYVLNSVRQQKIGLAPKSPISKRTLQETNPIAFALTEYFNLNFFVMCHTYRSKVLLRGLFLARTHYRR